MLANQADNPFLNCEASMRANRFVPVHPMLAVRYEPTIHKASASAVFLTGSFWMNATPMAAALATIRRLAEIDGVGLMRRAGARLRAGILAQAIDNGLAVAYTGPETSPACPLGGLAHPDSARGRDPPRRRSASQSR